jgi:hypothetical protein
MTFGPKRKLASSFTRVAAWARAMKEKRTVAKKERDMRI